MMKRRGWVSLCGAVSLLVGACAPISAEKVAATARPSGDTGQEERFWQVKTEKQLVEQLSIIEAACADSTAARECALTRVSAALPTTTEYQVHCAKAGVLRAVTQCMLEYDFWAKMGRKYYPSYRIKDAWASFNLTDNPTWMEWFTRRLSECDPNMNKSQEVGDACIADRAKREFAIEYDATKRCYYDRPSLAVFCYWMAGFDKFVREQVAVLESSV